ncbi:uncharacterized protein LOC117639916 [Thrips palmi]|uniref:Uncharacterized protein LOC117639916 n=1 Tax=Thrips palmi TaxID=161013 RepID=A0A6P8YDI3_THRPL|nr:uncharacterized protein LOC117639916 [Thrips palmi]XP_034231855.1 uncharacterized protein LOC117639916 [Thrips palmi]XP_034231856.1 uncharacterized protein LOC117639916 [Thrips palmi]XP_034231857.1 uncharacterized protein LOC117639916 [Thrips palmi]XP_034231858.1 uncharacterized protein LOC117639916 [Thrips palmi]XP_034231859.1 uncharacterized protein LOC117639916 [Thrips palmi]XP_034231860.1 uncharacterized protein LOC117639916 [Thrips palmi]XP_034231861.1 uncharacterized protein LOC1176
MPGNTARFWCESCKREASAQCVEEHLIRSLKKARVEEAGPLLQTLQQADAALDQVSEMLRGLQAKAEQEKAGVAAALKGLEDAMGADGAAWEQAKQAALQAGVSKSTAQLATDLFDATTRCRVTVLRGAAGVAAWQSDVRPATDAAARLLLLQLACRGHLEEPGQQPRQPSPAPSAPRWKERPNEGKWAMTEADMAASMAVGSRVARGRNWSKGCDADGEPPGLGTVTAKKEKGAVSVRWDYSGVVRCHCMGFDGTYQLRLLPTPLKPHIGAVEGESFLDVKTTCPMFLPKGMSTLLTDGRLAHVRYLAGLPCDVAPFWSCKVLDLVAPRLEGLQMVSPLQRHVDLALAMPHLRSLAITGVTGEHLELVNKMASLRSLELHCKLECCRS